MTSDVTTERDGHGYWRPGKPSALAPINHWPFDAKAVGKWLFGWPGFLWPRIEARRSALRKSTAV
ncbi:MAG: hypothetical protein AAF493_16040 [Pseudomonadota bacterium]